MTEAERIYASIIHKERPEDPEFLRWHPRMPLSRRAKIFSPFAALRGLKEKLEFEEAKVSFLDPPELADDQIERLNRILCSLQRGMRIRVTYFIPLHEGKGKLCTVTGRAKEVDGRNQRLKLTEEPSADNAPPKNTVISFRALNEIVMLDTDE